jgi:hypothetical protein
MDLQYSQLRLILIRGKPAFRMAARWLPALSWAATAPPLLPSAEQRVLRALRPIAPNDGAEHFVAAGIMATAQLTEPARRIGANLG